MDHPPPPESKVVDPMMRDLFGKNHHEVSNDCAIKIQKLEARLTSGKPRRVLSPGDDEHDDDDVKRDDDEEEEEERPSTAQMRRLM